MKKPYTPITVTAPQMAFGPARWSDLAPSYNDIPEEFKDHHNPWVKLIGWWFFKGLSGSITLKAKPGFDHNAALSHVAAMMKSWEPKHEHKEAAAAYLMSLWFESTEQIENETYRKGHNGDACVHAEEREKELIRLATEALLVATAALGVWGDKLAPGTLEDFRCKERAFLRYALKESDEP
jgi:hypothetical protein